MSEPERLTPDELRSLFLFEALDDDQLAWLAERGRVVEYAAGSTIHVEGTPASCLFILLSGMLAMSSRVQGGELELFRTDYCGAYTGAFYAYISDEKMSQTYPGTARAVSDCRLYELQAVDFGQAVREWFPMAAHLLEGVSVQGFAATDTRNRHERLVALGTVTAGLTHELNNPVAAVMRATSMLRERESAMRAALAALAENGLEPAALASLIELIDQAIVRRTRDGEARSPLETSDREDELGEWLEEQGVAAGWEHASTLVDAGLDIDWAQSLEAVTPASGFERGLDYSVGALETAALLDEIADAAARISGLLASAKQYTQMDRAPLQTFDVHEGLDATLTMLAHKIGDEIEVVRDYDRSLPKIDAFPGELNQVWTNLIDNAVDAMEGRGTLTVRTRRERDDSLVVEIADTGSGVPDDLRSRVFEPFFTTKDFGAGTGLGLDIAWRIVVGRHGGEIRLESTPGDTRFEVVLPLRQPDFDAELPR
jgi:signal transduction histidine kinase